MEKVKVLIVDDHYMFLKGLESILKEDRSLEVVGEAHNGGEAISLAKTLRPDVILMDVHMPFLDGIQALRIIMAEMPEIKVLMLTVNDNEEDLLEAMKGGAKGYLLKNLLPNELLAFIHMVNRGEYIISSPMARKIIDTVFLTGKKDRIQEEGNRKNSMLTRREKEILSQVIKGMTNREIANALFISENTVKNHIRNIMEKLHMNNRAQAAAFAMKEGWLQHT